MDEIKSSLLGIVRYQLFGGERPRVDAGLSEILKEAKAQAVFTTVFPFLQNELMAQDPKEFAAAQERFFGSIIFNTNNFKEHTELHELMKQNGIPYSAIKGLASAYYYPDPTLRDMGDVDYLVYEKDFDRAKDAVTGAGFEIDHGDKADSIHIAFKREPMSVWEQHRCVNGIPGGVAGERIRAEINRTIETSELVELEKMPCRIPDAFHHGLIMLLHVASHMTSEGVGLRHLCDWAVFAEKLGGDGFANLFENKLKSFGLWKFAKILTLVSERHLGITRSEWAQDPDITDEQLDEVIEDILSGGNFGRKDRNRYRETKYISNRGERTVDNKNIVAQALVTLNVKTCADYEFIDKHRFFLPAGWVAEGGKYFGLLITGKRKSQGTSAMLKEASKRKSIYSNMELFEING